MWECSALHCWYSTTITCVLNMNKFSWLARCKTISSAVQSAAKDCTAVQCYQQCDNVVLCQGGHEVSQMQEGGLHHGAASHPFRNL